MCLGKCIVLFLALCQFLTNLHVWRCVYYVYDAQELSGEGGTIIMCPSAYTVVSREL